MSQPLQEFIKHMNDVLRNIKIQKNLDDILAQMNTLLKTKTTINFEGRNVDITRLTVLVLARKRQRMERDKMYSDLIKLGLEMLSIHRQPSSKADDLMSILQLALNLYPFIGSSEQSKSNDISSILQFALNWLPYIFSDQDDDDEDDNETMGSCDEMAIEEEKKNKDSRLIGLIDGHCHFIDISTNIVTSKKYVTS